MPQKKNPRRELLEVLRNLKGNVKRLGWRLDVRSTVHLEQHERTGPEWHRPRRAEGYPENDREELMMAIRFADALMADANRIKTIANRRLIEITKEEMRNYAR